MPKGTREADKTKDFVLSVYEHARCVHQAFGSVIMSGPVEIGRGFDETASWLDAAYSIMNGKQKNEKK
jgi:hypothetical protein